MNSAQHEDALLRFVSALTFDDLPSATVESTLALVLDHLACGVFGAGLPWTIAVRNVALRHAGSGEAVLYGTGEHVPPAVAALVNGTAGHAFDLDDLYFPTMTHPGCVIVPAVLAVAAETGAGGRETLAAIVAGYEVMCRLGRASGLGHGERGFHGTGQHGAVGAASAVAAVRGWNQAELASAVGVASSLGAGVKSFTNGPGMVKRLHAGRAAESGVFATELVAAGFEGPRDALTGKFGLAHVLANAGGETARPEELSRGLGAPYLVNAIYVKPYAACGALHGAVQAAASLAPLPGDPDPVDAVERVVVGTSRRVLGQNSDPTPRDPMSVQYSMEVSVALALLGGAQDPERFLTAADDPGGPAMRLARLVELEIDPAADESYPDPNLGRVDVHLRRGRVLSARGRSDRESSRGWSVARQKFLDITASTLGDAREPVVTTVQALAEGRPVSDMLLAAGAASSR